MFSADMYKLSKNIAKYSFLSFGLGKIIDMKVGGSLNIDSKDLFVKAQKNYSKLTNDKKKDEWWKNQPN